MFSTVILSSNLQISHYAGICNKRLERIGIGGRLAPKKPTLEDIDQSRLQIFRPSMFGGTLQVFTFTLEVFLVTFANLQEILDIQKDRFPSRRLPWILTTLTDQIISLNGLATEGIFRIPADFDEVILKHLECSTIFSFDCCDQGLDQSPQKCQSR